MKPISLRGVLIGEGRPKLCVPLMGADAGELLAEAGQALAEGAGLAEWRADYFREASDPGRVLDALTRLRRTLGETPLLYTFRTQREGGVQPSETEPRLRLTCLIAESGLADAVDVELSEGGSAVERVVEAAHRKGTAVVVSSHDFQRTPKRQEILATLRRMRELGGDIPKMAVTPARFADVLTLMSAVDEYTQTADCPVIAMSMTPLGRISRIAGELYGSAVTFGSAGRASAPGQLSAGDLRTALEILRL